MDESDDLFTEALDALRPEAYDQIKAITDEKRISMADWVRKAVDASLANEKQSEESTYDK